MSDTAKKDDDFSFKNYFFPFTTVKAVHWLIFIGIIVYSNSLFNGFVFDDIGSIVTNPSVHSLSKIPSLFISQLTGFDANIFYRPLPFIIYNVIYSFFSINPFFYHLVQLTIHISNVLLTLFILKRFIKIHIAFILSLFFLIHPLNQEAVIYISAMHETLFVFFGLFATYLLLKNSVKTHYIIAANISLLAALFSKETALLFLPLGFLLVFFFNKQKIFIHTICSIIVGLSYFLLRLNANVQHPEIAVVPMMNLSFLDRLKSLPEIIYFYIQALIFPIGITHTNSWYVQSLTIENFYLPLVFDCIFLFGIMWLFLKVISKNKKQAILFGMWFLVGLGIHTQIIPLDATVAGRYFYFPFIGLLGFVGIFLQQIKLTKTFKKIVFIFLLILFIAYTAIAIHSNNLWRTQESIVAYDQQFARDDYLQELLYSSELIKQQRYKDAYPHAAKAIHLYPKSYYAWNNLGVTYYYLGEIELARKAYEKSMSLADYYGTYDNMALLLIEKDSVMNARAFLRKATVRFPNDEKLWGYRIYAEYKTGDLKQAKESAKYYFLLRKDSKSQDIYKRLQNNIRIDL